MIVQLIKSNESSNWRNVLKWACAVGWVAWFTLSVVMLFPSHPPFFSAATYDEGIVTSSNAALGHLLLFAGLGFLTLTVIRSLVGDRWPKASLAAALVVGMTWGAVTEWYQTTSSARDGSLEDLGINFAGVAAGVILAWGQIALLGRRQPSPLA